LQSSSDTQVSQLLSLIANLQDEKDSLEDELNIVKTSLVQLQVDVIGFTGENNSLKRNNLLQICTTYAQQNIINTRN